MSEFFDLEDFPTYADEQYLRELESGRRETAPAVRIVDFPHFIGAVEESTEPLLGTQNDTILPLDGMLLMYGDGGAGKTTLTIDAVSHLGSGESWLGIPVERPVKTLLIENEGPRGKFRQRLAEKDASWNGHLPFSSNVHVLEDPWTRFTLREQRHREALAASVSSLEIDLVVMGPLVTLGMIGGGTPEEVSGFETLLRELRLLITRPVSFWIIHHENKAGDVSGAWERVPDALCHVQGLGNGHTRIVFQKARWADGYHGTKLDLVWTEGRSYTIQEERSRDLHMEILQAFDADDRWRTAKEIAKLISGKAAKVGEALSDLVERDEMVLVKGPKGRHGSALCYRLQGVPTDREHPGTPSLLDGFDEVGVPAAHPLKGGAGTGNTQPEPRDKVRPTPGTPHADPLREEPPF